MVARAYFPCLEQLRYLLRGLDENVRATVMVTVVALRA
jgi:hypothetical protein